MWITAKEVKEKLKICDQTLNNWRRSNKIVFKKINSRNFLYDLSSLVPFSNIEENKKHVIYARVSNTKQFTDLKRQTQLLQDFLSSKGIIPDHIFEDIASGMNENRSQFNKLIALVFKNEIDTIYITYQDRLTRFGFKLLESIFSNFNTSIKVINATREEDFQQELTTDLVSIIHHFSMKLYSNRRKVLKELKKELLKNENN